MLNYIFPYKLEVWFSDESKCIMRREYSDYNRAKQQVIEYSEVTPFIVKLINYKTMETEIYKGGVKQCQTINN